MALEQSKEKSGRDRPPPPSEVGLKFLRLARQLSIRDPIVCDIGSRDAVEGLFLFKHLEAKELHVFEANPRAILLCSDNIDAFAQGTPYGNRISLNQVAISDENGEATLHAVDEELSDNKDIGFSSLYYINSRYTKRRGHISQVPVKVKTLTLDRYFRNRSLPDILWIDVEGAELRVLRGARRCLRRVKLIHVEVSFRPMQLSTPLFWEVDHHLKGQGFQLVGFEEVGRIRSYMMRRRLHPNLPWRLNGIYCRQPA